MGPEGDSPAEIMPARVRPMLAAGFDASRWEPETRAFERKKRLEEVLAGRELSRVLYVPHYRDWEGLLFTVNQMGGEGIVGKRKRSVYKPGVRSNDWMKYKIRNYLNFTEIDTKS